ncbi:MAG: UDP-N-acetylmuramate dehydrogenase [Firmicutes bacterium]|nr:UDP-N-acetylmuramate dehydrogenase [Bacillota bacterium]
MDIKKLAEISENIVFDEEMKRHTTFRIGGAADAFADVGSAEEIAALIMACRSGDIPYIIVGNGSNLLVSDKGIRGLVIHIGRNMSGCVVEGEEIFAEAGILMSALASKAAAAELTGFEELSGIPGTLGGGIFMNAGAYGGEMKNVLEEVTFLNADGGIETKSADELELGYRTSVFQTKPYVILSCRLKLKKGSADEIRAKTDEYKKRRTEKQPLSLPSAGSTFKRPEGYFAGKLIEDSGLKGYSVGGAAVSELHSGFVVNRGGATAKDVSELIEYVQKTVKEKFGVNLEAEVRFVGEK